MMRTAGVLLVVTLFAMMCMAQEKTEAGKTAATKPVVKTFVAPGYPPLARDARYGGQVEAELSIDASGAVTSVRIVSSHPFFFAKYVEYALARWRFEPSSGPQQLFVTVSFELTGCTGSKGGCHVAPEERVSAELPDTVLVTTQPECSGVIYTR